MINEMKQLYYWTVLLKMLKERFWRKTHSHTESVAVRNCLVSLRAEAVSADRVAELQTGLLDVRAAATGAAECKHERPFVWTWQAEGRLSKPGPRSETHRRHLSGLR